MSVIFEKETFAIINVYHCIDNVGRSKQLFFLIITIETDIIER